VIGLGAGEPDFEHTQNIKAQGSPRSPRARTKYTALTASQSLAGDSCGQVQRDNGLTIPRRRSASHGAGKQILYNALMATMNPAKRS